LIYSSFHNAFITSLLREMFYLSTFSKAIIRDLRENIKAIKGYFMEKGKPDDFRVVLSPFFYPLVLV